MRGNVRVHQGKIRAKKRKRALLLSLSALSAFAVVIALLAWLSHAGFMKVVDIEVVGTRRLSSDFVASSTRSLLEGRYLGMFSRGSVALYPHGAIEEALLSIPVVKTVDVGSRGLHAITIAVEERVETARYCEGSAGDFSMCLALDEEGFAFAPSEDDSMVAYRNATTSLSLGDTVFSGSGNFKNMQFFLRELAGLDLAPREAVIGEAGYVTILLGGGGRLIVNTIDDLSGVLSNLSSILRDPSVVTGLDDFLSRLDYMRLDAGNKVFYKFRK